MLYYIKGTCQIQEEWREAEKKKEEHFFGDVDWAM